VPRVAADPLDAEPAALEPPEAAAPDPALPEPDPPAPPEPVCATAIPAAMTKLAASAALVVPRNLGMTPSNRAGPHGPLLEGSTATASPRFLDPGGFAKVARAQALRQPASAFSLAVGPAFRNDGRTIFVGRGRMSYHTLKFAVGEDRVGVITMNRPEARNAMNTAMMQELRDCFAGFYVDPNAVACLVLTGEGQGFCSGADLKERKGMPDEVWRRQHAIVEQMVRALLDCPIPIMAAVNGAAFAGGMELALGCDFIYAAQSARFALTEVTLGIMPGAAGTQNLPRAVGVRRAKELVLTGMPFTAEEAYAWGMVNKVCADAELMNEVMATARRIAANAPVSARQAKKALDKATELDRASGYAFEIEAYNRTVVTEDRQEGINAFNEKRKPQYKGR
jgi:enoyl-CoA hydratase/carnithine racemase